MVRDLLKRLKKTVLLVTHDLDEALFLASRIVLVEREESTRIFRRRSSGSRRIRRCRSTCALIEGKIRGKT